MAGILEAAGRVGVVVGEARLPGSPGLRRGGGGVGGQVPHRGRPAYNSCQSDGEAEGGAEGEPERRESVGNVVVEGVVRGAGPGCGGVAEADCTDEAAFGRPAPPLLAGEGVVVHGVGVGVGEERPALQRPRPPACPLAEAFAVARGGYVGLGRGPRLIPVLVHHAPRPVLLLTQAPANLLQTSSGWSDRGQLKRDWETDEPGQYPLLAQYRQSSEWALKTPATRVAP